MSEEKSIGKLLEDMNNLLTQTKKFEKDMEKLSDLSDVEDDAKLLDK